MKEYNFLSRYRLEKILRCFCLDMDASKMAELLGLDRKTVNRYFHKFREKIYHYQQLLMPLTGVVEVDESYFGASRVRGRVGRKRGHSTLKQPVFGVIERDGRVYTEIIPDVSAITLQKAIRGRVSIESIIISDGWRGYDGLVDVGYDKHLLINKSKNFALSGVHINGIEAFWSFTKRRLAKFNGVKPYFHPHLKECEWRYRKNTDTLQNELKKMIV